jgi:hypothetical protein
LIGFGGSRNTRAPSVSETVLLSPTRLTVLPEQVISSNVLGVLLDDFESCIAANHGELLGSEMAEMLCVKEQH